MNRERIHPEAIGVFGVAHGYVAGDSLCVAISSEDAKGGGEVLELPLPVGGEAFEFGDCGYCYAVVAHGFQRRELFLGRVILRFVLPRECDFGGLGCEGCCCWTHFREEIVIELMRGRFCYIRYDDGDTSGDGDRVDERYEDGITEQALLDIRRDDLLYAY